jgi:hypothetical protein
VISSCRFTAASARVTGTLVLREGDLETLAVPLVPTQRRDLFFMRLIHLDSK